MTSIYLAVLRNAWEALGGPADMAGALEVISHGPILSSPLPVEELLVAAAGSALLAYAEGTGATVALDTDRLAIAACSERWVRLDGQPMAMTFDPLSAFFRAADGWVRTHGNYSWHRNALRQVLGTDVAAAVRERTTAEVEDAVFAAGGCAVAVRASSPLPLEPLVVWSDGPPSDAPPRQRPRVLDLTRVIAGPVGTRMLAAMGADVTRVQPPHRPELRALALDGGLGKRWLELDLGSGDLEGELACADAIVLGYRPGALDRFGLHPDALAERHPNLVVVTLSAWGETGPWRTRRGFDSLVQAATGVAEGVGAGTQDTPPGALPVQALDHATGYLVAAAVMRALTVRTRDGRSPRARLSLAATADALLAAGRREPPGERHIDPTPHLVNLGRLQVARPPGVIDGAELRWPEAPLAAVSDIAAGSA